MTRALLEQALDALEDCDTAIKHLMQPAHPEVQITKTSATDVMKAIRAHLAKPQGEPVTVAPKGLVRCPPTAYAEQERTLLAYIDAQAQEIERLKSENTRLLSDVTRPESTEMTLMRTLAQSRGEEIERLREDADNAADTAVIALRKAWQLGQTYWQQADSEYTSHHAKADVTQQKFKTLCDETSAAMKGETP